MVENEPQLSVTINHFIFDHIEFKRLGFHNGENKNSDIPIQLSVSIKNVSEGEYIVTLRVFAEKKDEYTAEVTISGYCTLDEANPNKIILLKENVPAILLPYARAQMTMLTAQPEMEPILLPVINIHDMANQDHE